MDIPGDLVHLLSKGNLRRQDVKIDGADWPRMTLYCANERCRRPFVSTGGVRRPTPQVVLEPLPDFGDHMTREAFTALCHDGMLTDDDGSGCWATAKRMSRRSVSCADPTQGPKWATHVVWFNK